MLDDSILLLIIIIFIKVMYPIHAAHWQLLSVSLDIKLEEQLSKPTTPNIKFPPAVHLKP